MNSQLEYLLKFNECFKGNQQIEYKGALYPCSLSNDTTLFNLEAGGFSDQIDIIFLIRKSEFTDGIFPQDQETVINNSTTYRVHKVQNDAFNTFLQLACVDPNRGV